MTPVEIFLNSLIKINIWLIIKVAYLFAIGLYVIFSFMLVKEVSLMNKTISGLANLPIKIIAWLNLILAILIFVIAVIIL